MLVDSCVSELHVNRDDDATHVRNSTYTHTTIRAYIHIYISIYKYTHTYMYAHIYRVTYTYIHKLHTLIRTYIIHTYIP